MLAGRQCRHGDRGDCRRRAAPQPGSCSDWATDVGSARARSGGANGGSGPTEDTGGNRCRVSGNEVDHHPATQSGRRAVPFAHYAGENVAHAIWRAN